MIIDIHAQSYEDSFALVDALNLSASDKEKILGKNAEFILDQKQEVER